MMPLADVSQAYAQLETQPGTSFAGTSEIAKQVEQLLLKQPEVDEGLLRGRASSRAAPTSRATAWAR